MTDDLDLICTIRDDANLITATLLAKKDVLGKTLQPLTEFERTEIKSAQAILARIGEDLEEEN